MAFKIVLHINSSLKCVSIYLPENHYHKCAQPVVAGCRAMPIILEKN